MRRAYYIALTTKDRSWIMQKEGGKSVYCEFCSKKKAIEYTLLLFEWFIWAEIRMELQ